ncbi:DUF4136 domain-containing protein [Sulfurimonas sp.]|uniref:DUF4136 domain-containing protein n=1 Tax=Sulfurimonas sp. TaxID=2022749 RepID=UPI003D09905F
MKWIYAVFLTIFLVGCSTVDVNVDYDQQYKFLEVDCFAVEHETKQGESTLVNDRITTAIKQQITQKGYQNTSTAGLVFNYFYKAQDKKDFQTSYGLGTGFGRLGWGGGMMVSTTDTYEYTEGTLVIDALDAKTKKIVWRGVGVLELREQKTPQEKTEYVNSIVAKILEKFPSKIVQQEK